MHVRYMYRALVILKETVGIFGKNYRFATLLCICVRCWLQFARSTADIAEALYFNSVQTELQLESSFPTNKFVICDIRVGLVLHHTRALKFSAVESRAKRSVKRETPFSFSICIFDFLRRRI